MSVLNSQPYLNVLSVSACLSLCAYVHVASVEARQGVAPLALVLQVLVSCPIWVLGTELRFSLREAYTRFLENHLIF